MLAFCSPVRACQCPSTQLLSPKNLSPQFFHIYSILFVSVDTSVVQTHSTFNLTILIITSLMPQRPAHSDQFTLCRHPWACQFTISESSAIPWIKITTKEVGQLCGLSTTCGLWVSSQIPLAFSSLKQEGYSKHKHSFLPLVIVLLVLAVAFLCINESLHFAITTNHSWFILITMVVSHMCAYSNHGKGNTNQHAFPQLMTF